MKKILLKLYPALTIILFPAFFVYRLFLDSYLFYGEERGFLNYDFANYRYDKIWESTKNFGAITSNHFNIFTTGLFWKVTTFFNLSSLHAEMLFYYCMVLVTILIAYFAFKKISKNIPFSLLMSLVYITTYNYYATITTTPKMLQVIILPMTLYLWLMFIDTKKIRYFLLNTLYLGLFLGIGTNPPQMIGAYVLIFLYIGLFNLKRSNLKYILLFTAPFLLNVLFVFILNTIVIRHSAQVYSYDIFKEVFSATHAVAYEVMRFFGAWWDYAGSGGLFYNHIGPYYHSYPGVIITYIPFIIFIYLLLEQKRPDISIRNKLIALVLLTIFLVKGGAMPFGALFDKAYNHISLLRIFREPWAKFIIDFIFVIYISITYFFSTATEKAKKYVLYLLSFLLVFQLIPLGLGLVIDHRNISWKVSDVNIPDYWYTMRDWTKQNTQHKRVLVLPGKIDDAGTIVQNWKPYYFIGYPDDYFMYGDIINTQYNTDEDKYITQNFFKNLTPQMLAMSSTDYVINKLDLAPQKNQKLVNIDSISSALNIENKTSLIGIDIYPVKDEFKTQRLRSVKHIKRGPKSCDTFFKTHSKSDLVTTAYINQDVSQLAGNVGQSKPTITKINATEYKLDFADTESNSAIFFAETYNTGWKWYDSTSNFARPLNIEVDHQLANCFANLWILPREVTNNYKTLYLRYEPQIMYEQLKIAYLTIIGLLVLIGFIITRKIPPHDSSRNQLNFFSPSRIITILFDRFKPKNFGKLKIEYRLVFLGVTLIMLVFDFFEPRFYFDAYIVIFSIFWIVTSISYKLNPRVNIYIAGFFLFLTIINRLASFIYLADKLGVWTLMFIAYIGIYSLLYDYIKVERTDTFDDFIKKVKNDIAYFEQHHNTFLSKLLWILHATMTKTQYWIIRIYGTRTKNKTPKDWAVLWTKVGVTIIVLTAGFLVYRKADSIINRYAFDPVISKVEPQIIYPSTKVIITGRNFGRKENEGSLLQNQYGTVETELWTDTKIIFETPLSWKTGEIQFRIVKPNNYEGQYIYAFSQIFKLLLIPRSQKFTPQDDAFFKQLPLLDPETRKINGYE